MHVTLQKHYNFEKDNVALKITFGVIKMDNVKKRTQKYKFDEKLCSKWLNNVKCILKCINYEIMCWIKMLYH